MISLYDQSCSNEYWSNLDVCTTINSHKYTNCVELDGTFVAGKTAFMASELEWAVDRWGKQTDWIVDVLEKQKQLAGKDGLSQCMVRRWYGRRHGVWLVCRYI